MGQFGGIVLDARESLHRDLREGLDRAAANQLDGAPRGAIDADGGEPDPGADRHFLHAHGGEKGELDIDAAGVEHQIAAQYSPVDLPARLPVMESDRKSEQSRVGKEGVRTWRVRGSA